MTAVVREAIMWPPIFVLPGQHFTRSRIAGPQKTVAADRGGQLNGNEARV